MTRSTSLDSVRHNMINTIEQDSSLVPRMILKELQEEELNLMEQLTRIRNDSKLIKPKKSKEILTRSKPKMWFTDQDMKTDKNLNALNRFVSSEGPLKIASPVTYCLIHVILRYLKEVGVVSEVNFEYTDTVHFLNQNTSTSKHHFLFLSDYALNAHKDIRHGNLYERIMTVGNTRQYLLRPPLSTPCSGKVLVVDNSAAFEKLFEFQTRKAKHKFPHFAELKLNEVLPYEITELYQIIRSNECADHIIAWHPCARILIDQFQYISVAGHDHTIPVSLYINSEFLSDNNNVEAVVAFVSVLMSAFIVRGNPELYYTKYLLNDDHFHNHYAKAIGSSFQQEKKIAPNQPTCDEPNLFKIFLQIHYEQPGLLELFDCIGDVFREYNWIVGTQRIGEQLENPRYKHRLPGGRIPSKGTIGNRINKIKDLFAEHGITLFDPNQNEKETPVLIPEGRTTLNFLKKWLAGLHNLQVTLHNG